MLSLSSAANLLKVKKTQLEMIRDRGYDISEEKHLLEPDYDENKFLSEYNRLLEETNKRIREENDRITGKRALKQPELTFRDLLSRIYMNSEGSKLLVKYAEPPSPSDKSKHLNVEYIDRFTELAMKEGVTWAILISEQDLSTTAGKRLEEYPTIHFQHFFEDELRFNPTKHYLVPRHELLSPQEAQAFLRENKLVPTKLPHLKYVPPFSRTGERKAFIDPIVKYYGFLPGQIVRIYRENFITETPVDKIVTYRYVWY
jgi:DNA-directed RNA polymerase I, II, and III subunit RPABC1